MNYLSLLAIYTLFHVIIEKELISRATLDLSSVGKNFFGVFVTLTRNPDSKVHGCVGNWSSTFEKMSSETLVNWVKKLVLDARHRDQRRFQFSKDVNEDVSTNLTISLMLLPFYKVDTYTGMIEDTKKFRNEEYGLIFQSKNGQRATYLPDVFSNETWENVSTSLMNKAGITSREQGTYYAYNTLTIQVNVYDLLFSLSGKYFLEREVASFYDKYFDDFIPYEFNSKTKKAIIDKTESVRNSGCLLNVIHLSEKFKGELSWVDKPVLQNLDYYFKQWYLYKEEFTQASIFLLQAYSCLFNQGVNVENRISMIEEGLYDALLTLEPQFALGEAVSTLAPLVNTSTPVKNVSKLLKACKLMRSRLNTNPRLDLVFELNWQSQSAHKMLNLVMSRFPKYVPFFQSFVLELSEMVLSIVEDTFPDTLETNYLVVIYECLCHLEACLILSGKKVPDKLKEHKLSFYTTLLETRRGYNGLFYFKDKPVARLDLIGHTLLINC